MAAFAAAGSTTSCAVRDIVVTSRPRRHACADSQGATRDGADEERHDNLLGPEQCAERGHQLDVAPAGPPEQPAR